MCWTDFISSIFYQHFGISIISSHREVLKILLRKSRLPGLYRNYYSKVDWRKGMFLMMIICNLGERADFILKAAKAASSYSMSFSTSKSCSASPTTGSAILKYKGNSESEIKANKKSSGKVDVVGMRAKESHMTTNPIETCGSAGSVCVTEVKASKPLASPLNNSRTDVTIYLPINQRIQNSDIMGWSTKLSTSGEFAYRFIWNNEKIYNFFSYLKLTLQEEILKMKPHHFIYIKHLISS